MSPDERKEWAMRQPITIEDRENADDLLEDYMKEKDHALAFETIVMWCHKIRVEGGLAVLSQIPAKFAT